MSDASDIVDLVLAIDLRHATYLSGHIESIRACKQTIKKLARIIMTEYSVMMYGRDTYRVHMRRTNTCLW